MEITIRPRDVAIAFLLVVLALSFMNGLMLALYFLLDDPEVFGLLDYFDFDIEGNIPTLYSAFAVLVCAGLLGVITHANWRRDGGKRYYWLGLSVLFVFLAVDEGTAIHEQLSDYMEQFMTATGPLYFLWVVPYGFALLVLAALYTKFVWALPALTRTRFILAAIVFLAGAIGFEMLSASVADRYGYDTVLYCVLYSIEELLEMLGIVLFMYALLEYLASEPGGLVLRLSSPPE